MDDPTLLSWIERGQNIAALFVAIGVTGEFVLGFMAGPARRRVDATREAEVYDSQQSRRKPANGLPMLKSSWVVPIADCASK